MYHYQRSYKTARSVFAMAEFVGWSAVAVGVILPFVGMAGVSDSFGRDAPLGAYLLAMLPGIAVGLFGLFSVVTVQIGRANVDSVEIAGEMLALVKGDGAISKAFVAGSDGQNPFANETQGTDEFGATGITGNYRGEVFFVEGRQVFVHDKVFNSRVAAERYVDELKQSV